MSKSAAAPPARILSISGDPATVALSARVLAVLEQRTGQPVSALFHLIVGEGAGAALALGREGGHSKRRVVHSDGDATGKGLTRTLADRIRATEGVRVFAGLYMLAWADARRR